MRFIKLYEEHINESITDGSIEDFLEGTKIAIRMGLFSDPFFRDLKSNMTEGVRISLENETFDLPKNAHKQFLGYVKELTGLLEKTETISEFINELGLISEVKQNIIKRMKSEGKIEESTNFKNSISWIKKGLEGTKKQVTLWWNGNQNQIAKELGDILVNFMVSVFSMISTDMKNSE